MSVAKEKSKIIKTLQKIAQYGAFFGFGFYVFVFASAVRAKESDPDADLLDIGEEFYGGMANLTLNDFLPGAGIILSEAFKLTTETILPGAGFVLSKVFSATTSEKSEPASFDFLLEP